MIKCKNCGNEFEGNFCNNCGQKADIHRFTLKHALRDFAHTFTHVDRGILYLIKELFLRPGKVAKEYIEGSRKKYFNPMQYLILAVAAAAFLSAKFNLMGPDANTINPDVYSHLTETARMMLQFNQFIYKYFNLILFIAVPVMAFFSWLFYRKSGYNFAENLVFHSFLGAQRTLIYILMAPFLYFFKKIWFVFIGIYYLGWIIYYGWAFVQFFEQKKSVVIIKYIIMLLLFLPAVQAISWGIFYLFFYHK
jgi:hypothetical protein